MKMDISEAGTLLLGMFEGIHKRSYKDTGGYWTAGVGHLITSPRDPVLLQVLGVNEIDPTNVTLTMSQVHQVFSIDQRSRVEQVNSVLTRPVTQIQFDVIIDFVFNMGIGTFKNGKPSKGKASLLNAINTATDTSYIIDVIYQYSTFQDQFLEGRLKRRFIEATLFNDPETVERPEGLTDKWYADALNIIKKYREAIV